MANVKASEAELFVNTNRVQFENPKIHSDDDAAALKAMDMAVPDLTGGLSLPKGTKFKIIGYASADTKGDGRPTKKGSFFLVVTKEGEDREYRVPAGTILTGFPPADTIIDASYPNKEQMLNVKAIAQTEDVWRPNGAASKSYLDLVGKDLVSVDQLRNVTRMTQKSATWEGGEISVNMLAFKVAA